MKTSGYPAENSNETHDIQLTKRLEEATDDFVLSQGSVGIIYQHAPLFLPGRLLSLCSTSSQGKPYMYMATWELYNLTSRAFLSFFACRFSLSHCTQLTECLEEAKSSAIVPVVNWRLSNTIHYDFYILQYSL